MFELFRGPHEVPSRISRTYLSPKLRNKRVHELFYSHCALKLAQFSQCREFPAICAARGKLISTLAVFTQSYLHPKFHEIIFQVDQTAAI